VTELQELKEAIATHLSRAAEKLRLYRLTANVLQVFAHTSRFRDNYYSNGVTISLPVATQDTRELLFFAMHGAEAIYRPGHAFSKAGVLLLELQPETLVEQQFQIQNFRSLKPLIHRSNQAPLRGLDRLKRRKLVLNLE
jgi:DNA polymerase V